PGGRPGLDGARPLARVHGTDQAVGARGTVEHAVLGQGPDALLEEEGIAARALDEEALEGVELAGLPDEGIEELVGAGGRQRIDPDPRVRPGAGPRPLVLG